MASYTIREAAGLLGVSDDTVRRWIDADLLSVTGASPTRVDGESLASRAVTIAVEPDDPTGVSRTARNRLTGLITSIVADTVMAKVEIQAGPFRLVSLVSSEAVQELGLEVGGLGVAVVKSTNVIIETPRPAR